jgi:starvation-inducible DNA-binding protein
MNRPLWDTRNDLPEQVRVGAIELLNHQLSDVLDLSLQAKQAHWNVKGPSFIALHELFDEVVKELGEYADDLAERAVELGGTALGTARIVAKALGDADTVDLFTQISRGVDKLLWKVAAHAQATD